MARSVIVRRGYIVMMVVAVLMWETLPIFREQTMALGLSLDKTVSTHQSSGASSITSTAFTTSQPNELLVVFLASDGPSGAGSVSFSGITGSSLTWTLRKRTNAQPGTAEIWTAVAPSVLTNAAFKATRTSGSYQGDMTIAAFIGASTTNVGAVGGGSATTGAPSASLTTTTPGSWVWGTGDDYTNAAKRTVGANQTLTDQFLSPAQDTYWTQQQTVVTPNAGTVVTINDPAPTNDRWDLSLIEILPVTVDTLPPTTPTNVAAVASSPTQATVSWAASADNVGVSGYSVFRDGVRISTTTSTTYADSSLSPNSSYNYTVQAYDAAGNTSPYSTTVTATTPLDTTPPLISSVATTLLTASGANVTWSTDKTANSQVSYGTTTAYGSSTTLDQTFVTSHSQALVDLSPATTYHYAVSSTDAYGNMAVSADNTFVTPTIDTTPPTVQLTAPSDGAIVSGTTVISAQASDNTGVTGVQFLLDGQNLGAVIASAPYNLTWNSTTTSNGTHTLSALAYDAAGNAGAATTKTITVNNQASVAPAIDPSTPAATAVQNNVPLTTSPSFSPPATTVIYAVFSMDSASYNGHITSVNAITTTGAPITWHLLGRNNNYSSTAGGFLEVWWAYNPTAQTNITATATFSQNTKNVAPPVGDFQILVMDNAAADQSTAAWNANWLLTSIGNTPSVNITTTKANSQVFSVFDNWNNSQTPLPGANQSIQSIVLNPTDVDGYWLQSQNTPTAAAGTAVTMNATDPGQANEWRALAWEVLAAN
jgi:hypothetical protein